MIATLETEKKAVIAGTFRSREVVCQVVDELRAAGFVSEEIGIAGRDAEGDLNANLNCQAETLAGEGAVAGLIAGSTIGGLFGLGVVSGVFPAIGPAFAAGSLALLFDTAGGAAIGGLAGALIGWGIPDTLARYYEDEVHQGRFLVTVKCGDRYHNARTIFRHHGAESLDKSYV